MEKVLYKAVSVPQEAGTVEEVLNRADLGRAKFPQLVEYRQSLRQRLASTLPPHEREEGLRYFDQTHPITLDRYILDFEPKIAPDTLKLSLAPVISATQAIFMKYSIPFPEDTPDRIVVVGEETFGNAVLQEIDSNPHGFLVAATLPNRLILLSKLRLEAVSERFKVNKGDLMRNFVAFELLSNSLVYQESWVAEGGPDQVKRHGLAVSPPIDDSNLLHASLRLHKGFSHYLTMIALYLSQTPILPFMDYTKEGALATRIADQIGTQHLMDAAYLPKGIRSWSEAMDRMYSGPKRGGGALKKLFDAIMLDLNTPQHSKLIQNQFTPYDYTMSFLNAPKVRLV